MKAQPGGRGHARAGIVSALWRYPVKSMAGEALASTDLSWAGLAGDRRWAFVRADSERSGFPWHTIREFPQMSNYVALLGEPARPDRSPVLVRTPEGGRYDVADPRLAAELGTGVRVMRLDRGAFDAMPVSVISDSTVAALCTLARVPGNELRFRPNVVVTPDSGAPFAEDEWVGFRRPDRSCRRADRPQGLAMRDRRRGSGCRPARVAPAQGDRHGPGGMRGRLRNDGAARPDPRRRPGRHRKAA